MMGRSVKLFFDGKNYITTIPLYCACRIQACILIRHEFLCELLAFLLHNIGRYAAPTIPNLFFGTFLNSLFLNKQHIKGEGG